MTPEERAEARRLVDAATPGTSVAWISYALRLARKTGLDFADIEPDLTLNAATETDAELFAAARTLVPKLLDALEAAERERDEAQAKLSNLHFMYDGCRIDLQATSDRLAEIEHRLNEVLDYAGHHNHCPAAVYSVGVPVFCNCGWDKIRRMPRES